MLPHSCPPHSVPLHFRHSHLKQHQQGTAQLAPLALRRPYIQRTYLSAPHSDMADEALQTWSRSHDFFRRLYVHNSVYNDIVQAFHVSCLVSALSCPGELGPLVARRGTQADQRSHAAFQVGIPRSRGSARQFRHCRNHSLPVTGSSRNQWTWIQFPVLLMWKYAGQVLIRAPAVQSSRFIS